ncbi:hypothetical protein N7522_002755, partial [Penicillium canescens]
NGRRYHLYHAGEYLLGKPNDEMEQDRLDLTHHIYLMLLNGALHLAPVKTPARVLDLGTGTGIWAIDFSDEHPESQVIGKLSSYHGYQSAAFTHILQGSISVRFNHYGTIQHWTYVLEVLTCLGHRQIVGLKLTTTSYHGSIANPSTIFTAASWKERFATTAGYSAKLLTTSTQMDGLRMAAFEVNKMSDDNTHFKATCLLSRISNIHTSSKIFGKDMTSVSSWRRWMIKAGFVNVKEGVYKVCEPVLGTPKGTSLIANKLPQGPWSTDPSLQELGRYHQLNMLQALSSYTYALFTRVLGWQRIEIEALLAGARRELRTPSNHLYTRAYIVYGQIPPITQRNSIHTN